MRVRLSGSVVSNDAAAIYKRWGYLDQCCPNDIRAALESCPKDEELIFEINSYGGSVYAGFEMYTLLRSAGRPVTAEIQSLAASAASVFAVGCDTVVMSPVAHMMIHRSSTSARGNSEDMGQAKQMLDTIDESILDAYCAKIGEDADRDELLELMESETFLSAEEAIELGLADSIMEFGEGAEDVNPALAVASAADAAKLLAGQLPPVEDLLRLEAGRKADEEPQDDAGLNIDPEGEPGVQNTDAKERDESMEPKTLDQLMAEYPDQMNEARTAGATAERERITAIYAQAMPGFDKLVEDAVNDPTKTAGDVAMAIIAEQKKQGAAYLTGAKDDAGKANEVPADSAPADEADDSKADAKSTAELWKKQKGGK